VSEIMTARRTPAIDWTGIPRTFSDPYRRKVSAVCRSLVEAQDLVKWFGDEDFCPFLPVLVYIPDHPQLLGGFGQASASELQDLAIAVWEIVNERLEKTGRSQDFDDYRERMGLMRSEDVDAAFRQALMDRIARHKANPVTDPPREPLWVRVNAKTVHTTPDSQEWKVEVSQ
jgi:hypothetical protein